MNSSSVPAQFPSGFQAYPVSNAQIKKYYENPADDPDYRPERQGFGYFIFVMTSIGFTVIVIAYAFMSLDYSVYLFNASAHCFSLYFAIKSLSDPKYLGGRPKYYKLWPYVVSNFLSTIGNVLISEYYDISSVLIFSILSSVIGLILNYYIYIQDDTNPNCFICLKPWVYKKRIVYPTQQFPIQYHPQAYPQSSHGYQPNAHQAYHQAPPQAFINLQQLYSPSSQAYQVPQAHSPGPQAPQDFQSPPSYAQSVPSKH